MAESNISELKEAFMAYSKVTCRDPNKATTMTLRKWCKDTGISQSKMKQNDIDLEYSRCFGISKQPIDFKAFVAFVKDYFGPVYGKMNGIEQEEAIAELMDKLSKARPQFTHTTKTANDALTQRLVDPESYPQAYKNRTNPESKPSNYKPAPGRRGGKQ